MTSVPRNSICSQERTGGGAIRDARHVARAAPRECRPPRSYAAARGARRGGTCRLERGPTQALGLRGTPARRPVRRRGGRACRPIWPRWSVSTAPADSVLIGVDAPIGLPVAYARAAGIDRFLPWLRRADGAGSRAVVPRRGESGGHRCGPTLLPAAAGRGASCPPGGGSRPVVVRRPPPRLRPLAAVGPTRGVAVLDDGRQPGRQGCGDAVGRSRQRPGGAGVALRRRPRGPGSRAAGRSSPRPTRPPSAGTWAWRGARVRASAVRPIASAAPRPWPAPPDDWAWSSRRTSRAALHDGFGAASTGEDAYDAFVGLLGVVNVLRGGRSAGPPPGAPHATTVEGWILGVG